MSEQESAERPTDPAAAPADAHPRATWFAALTRLWLLLPIRSAPRGIAHPCRIHHGSRMVGVLGRGRPPGDPTRSAIFRRWHSLAGLVRAGHRGAGRPPAVAVPVTRCAWIRRGPCAQRGDRAGSAAAVHHRRRLLELFLVRRRGCRRCRFTSLSIWPAALHGVTGEPQRAAALTGLLFIAGFIGITDELECDSRCVDCGRNPGGRARRRRGRR